MKQQQISKAEKQQILKELNHALNMKVTFLLRHLRILKRLKKRLRKQTKKRILH